MPALSLNVVSRDAVEHVLAAEASRHIRIAQRLLSDPVRAEDALQEARIRALRHFPGVTGSLSAWVRTLVVRECLRLLERTPTFERFEDAPAPSPNDAMFARQLALALSTLSPQQRVAFTLKHAEGWTIPEIAQALGITDETVKTHLVRALSRTRQHFGVP